jgi:hypothetical protein
LHVRACGRPSILGVRMMNAMSLQTALVRLVRFGVSTAVIWTVVDYWYPAVGIVSVVVAGFVLMVFAEAPLGTRRSSRVEKDVTEPSS